MVGAFTAGLVAFGLTLVAFGTLTAVDDAVYWLAGIAFAIAAVYAAITTQWGLATAFGLLAVIWALFEGLAIIVGILAAGLG